jgi:hypothetical protein
MLSQTTTIFVSNSNPVTVYHFEESNSCYSMLLAGDRSTNGVKLYGTSSDLERFLEGALTALQEAKQTVAKCV